jgi:hypothetical protein
MKKYRVQQKASIWYEIEIKAKNKEEAQEIASQSLMSGNGEAVEGSFVWEDEFWTERENN